MRQAGLAEFSCCKNPGRFPYLTGAPPPCWFSINQCSNNHSAGGSKHISDNGAVFGRMGCPRAAVEQLRRVPTIHSRTFPFGDSIRKWRLRWRGVMPRKHAILRPTIRSHSPWPNSDSASNYVDRVRIRDSSNSFGGPGRGSGWRQKSLSNIDLPTSYRGIAGGGGGGGGGSSSITAGGGLGAGQFRYRDYDSGLYDLYSRIDSQREEYEDLYGVNPKAARAGSSSNDHRHSVDRVATATGSTSSSVVAAAAAGGNTGASSGAAAGAGGAVSGSKASGKRRHNRNQDASATSEHAGQHHHHHHHHHHHSAGGGGGSQQQQQLQQQFYNPDSNEACSLRRTRSLAVIREESYNELHLPGGRGGSRRSQLIPRAKLTDRNFFKERFSYIYDDNGELPPGSPDGDSGYSLARRFASSAAQQPGSIGSQQQPPFPWHTDKSDLDSIDSSIFKHSLHQQSSFEGSRRNSVRSDSTKFVSKVEVHSEYSGVSGSGGSGQSKSDTGVDADLRHLDDLSLREGGSSRKTGTSKNSTLETIKKGQKSSSASGRHRKPSAGTGGYPVEQLAGGNRNRKYGVKEEDESGITIIEIKDSQVSHKSSSVISYDSIYLSSESDEKELLEDGGPLPLLPREVEKRRRHEQDEDEDDPELIDIKFEDYEQLFHETDDLENAESTIDTLYGQVTKPKPKIVAVEPKVHGNDSLRRYIKNTSRSTIERLSLISNLKLRQEFGGNQELGASSPVASPGLRNGKDKQQQLPLTADSDYQYNSLPDADVCKILRNSERIDAKLRRIADSEHSGAHGSEEHGGRSRDGTAAFDSLPRLHKSSLGLTQPPSDEDISLEESDKGAPSIEVVETPTKEVLSHASSKVYLKDVGVELDYENSVVTGNSDQESDITIVAPQEDLEVPTPAIVVTPADKHQKQSQQQQQRSSAAPSTKGQRSVLSRPTTKPEQSVVYSTFASTAGKQTTSRINYESKEPKKPNPEALREVRTKLKPIPVVQTESNAAKVPLALAPTVKLGGKKVIVDEVAAKAAKREKELVKTTPTIPVVTVEKVTNQKQHPVKPTPSQPKTISVRDASPGGTAIATRPQEPIPIAAKAKESREEDEKQGSPKVDHSSLFKETNPFKEQARREIKNKVNDRPLFKGVRRFNSTENIYASTPIIVTKTFNNCIKTNEIKTKSFDSLIVENGGQCTNKLHPKMPRPQVIQIVDSKQQQHQQQQTMASNGGADTVRNTSKNGQQTQREFLHKVDSVRSYWSKMLDEVEQLVESDGDAVRADTDERLMNAKNDLLHQQLSSSKNGNAERKASIGSATSEASDSSKNTTSTKAASSSGGGGASIITTVSSSRDDVQDDGGSSNQLPRHTTSSSSRNKYSTYQLDDDDELNFQSFSPTVEIIELDGHKQAALVKPKNAKDLDFDHVRYKVMKSEMFQKNLLVNHRKAAQFDGLMQYLQDYSFQELLAHNNVVIIEPVRTKIEKISEKPPQMPAGVCKITNGALQAAGKQRQSNGTSSGIKKHFFYHPIRVNKELLDEELPSPDTVRNVRKLFEGTLRLGTAAKQAYEEAKANGTAGVKFKLVKSNSCSSRLELAGTGKTPPDLLRPNGRIRGRHHILEENGGGSGPGEMFEGAVEEEAEETVRDMVSRLESGGTLAPRSKPRIIESKCIEKYESGTDSPSPAITINNQTTLEKTIALVDDGPALTPVTVNNHINFVHHSATSTIPQPPPQIPAPLVIPTLLKGPGGGGKALECTVSVAPAMHINAAPHHTTSSMDRPVKVCRNKNVDLAFAATMRQIASMNSGTAATRAPSSSVRKSASLLSMSGDPATSFQDTTPTTDSAPQSASSVTKTVTFNFTAAGNGVHNKQEPPTANNNNENGIHHHPHQQQQQQQQDDHTTAGVVAVDQSENLRPSAIAEQRKIDELTSPKLVNWSTIGRFDERQYFANDRKLIEKRKYDDMEFEEFEVLDPNAPPSSEHYDSLNSKC
ncbi:protein javelin-like isoform X2 [Anopheles albimanus]|uniref:protein javelin-like isoform X2 n=1 Tax=Anopheles albimanus TaxID=7167 RepID=UPI00163E4AAB|nr:protein javelin-like isoform X2 [Anopheles albimanus]